ncbi:hypothetical protein ACVWU4_001017 [Campylobacter coli]
MEKSKFYLYTIGEVARDKLLSSYQIEVFPSEILPNTTIDPATVNSNVVNVSDMYGGISSINVDKTRTINCEWLPIGDSNRATPPDVVAGEKVFVYRYADTDMYFWTTTYFEVDLRKHETVTWLYSNKQEKSDISTATKNVYRFVVDTLHKFVEMFTNNNDGEYTTYSVKVNTKDGIITIVDGKQNTFTLESQKDTLTIDLKNELNIITTNKVNIKTTDINIEASNDINIKAGNNFNLTVGNNTKFSHGSSFKSNSGSDTSITGNPFNCN